MSKNNIVVEKKETSVIAEVASSKTVEITVPGHAASEFTQAIERLGEVERTAGEAKTSAEKSAGLANDAKAEAERLAREAGDYAGDAQGFAKSAGDFARAANQSAINAGKALTGANEAKSEALKAQEATAKDAEQTGADALQTGKDAKQTNADLQRLLAELDGYLKKTGGTLTGGLLTKNIAISEGSNLKMVDTYLIRDIAYNRFAFEVLGGAMFFLYDSKGGVRGTGGFSLLARNSSGTKSLNGDPSGRLLWDYNDVLTTGPQPDLTEAQQIASCLNIGASRVHDQGGSEREGRWVQFENGVQVCWMLTTTKKFGPLKKHGSLTRSDPVEFPFPVPFIEQPVLGSNVANTTAWATPSKESNTVWGVTLWGASEFTVGNFYLGLTAIGRWK